MPDGAWRGRIEPLVASDTIQQDFVATERAEVCFGPEGDTVRPRHLHHLLEIHPDAVTCVIEFDVAIDDDLEDLTPAVRTPFPALLSSINHPLRADSPDAPAGLVCLV